VVGCRRDHRWGRGAPNTFGGEPLVTGYGSQARWRAVKAKLLAKQGRLEEAEERAREAVRLAAPTDVLNLHGHCYLALGAVLEALGRQHEASEAFARAVQAFSRKGNLAAAGKARARMPPRRR
jgi:Flp pilus assembly protein TadD